MAESDAARSKRLRDRKRGGGPRQIAPCGTYAAYRRHLRKNEEPCEPCRQAYTDYQRGLQRARRANKKIETRNEQ